MFGLHKGHRNKARILGIEAQMKTFNYLFGVLLGEVILRNTDNLSRTLQHQHLFAAEGQNVASLTVKTLERIRTDKAFALFWKKAELVRSQHNLSEPEQPRRRKTLRRYKVGESLRDFHDTPESYCKQQYLEALDLIVKERFSQPEYTTYIKMQDLVMKAAKSEEYHNELLFVTNFYGVDLDKVHLEMQLSMVGPFCNELTNPSFKDVLEKFTCLSSAEQSHFSEVVNVLRLILTMSATNAVSECSASALCLIKTYLRTSISQLRMNNVMVLHVHKQSLDQMNMVEVANNFAADSEHWLTLFGKFTKCYKQLCHVCI